MTPDETLCFLCKPDSTLLVGESPNLFVMVGLGPVTDRYLMIAATNHVRSFADMYLEHSEIADELEEIRAKLQQDSKPLLMTEHGRVPACVDGNDEHEAHCFHAHFLLFQSASNIEQIASSYFMKSMRFRRLGEALSYASQSENYYLLSPCPENYIIFTGALNVPRQFFRYLVAIADEEAEKADWRLLPNREKAVADAAKERAAFRGLQCR